MASPPRGPLEAGFFHKPGRSPSDWRKKMEEKPNESLESKTCCAEPEEDLSPPGKYRDKDCRDFYFVTL